MAEPIVIQATVRASLDKVWKYWNSAEDIPFWAFASDDWGAESKTNDIVVGGRFVTRMYSKNSGQGFDFSGAYDEVVPNHVLAYTLDDGRKVRVEFTETADGVEIVQSFEPESENDLEFQRAGWQAFLDNFKKYAEIKG